MSTYCSILRIWTRDCRYATCFQMLYSCATLPVLVMYVCISTTYMFAAYGGISVYSSVKYACLYVCLFIFKHTHLYTVCITVYSIHVWIMRTQYAFYNDVHMSRNHRTHCVGTTQCRCFHFVCNLFRHGPRSRSQISWCGDP